MDFAKVLPKSRLRGAVWAACFALALALFALPLAFRLDGKTHADWQQFLGRFHPLAVHLPIGFLLLVPILELAAIVRPALREAAAFVLVLCILACATAALLGYLLAYGSGDLGATVVHHMWGGISLTAAVMLCAALRPAWSHDSAQGIARLAYPGALAGTLLLLAWTAHQGGTLTHGDNYLTQYLPDALKHAFGNDAGASNSGPGANSNANSFYAKRIHPLLDRNCVACHGASSRKGGLRLDSYQALMRGGEEGAAVIPGDAEHSLLIQRVTLPVEHKKFMPAEGKPPLKANEIEMLKAWIAQGASPSATTIAGVTMREEELPPPPVADYSALIGEIQQAARAAGVTVTPVSQNAPDGLILNAIDASATFGDAQLASFQKYAPYIVEAELARTSVTDASFETLAKFSQLRALHLEDTAVAGSGLGKLTALSQLRYLNLSGTKVSESSAAPLKAMKQLKHLYLYNTPAQPAAGIPGTGERSKESLQARQLQ